MPFGPFCRDAGSIIQPSPSLQNGLIQRCTIFEISSTSVPTLAGNSCSRTQPLTHQEAHCLPDVLELLPALAGEVGPGVVDPHLQLRKPRLDVLAVAEGAALAAEQQTEKRGEGWREGGSR